jgi:hypothetical protein
MGAMGMAVVGLVTTPQMGRVADAAGHERLPEEETVTLFQDVVAVFPSPAESIVDDPTAVDRQTARGAVEGVLAAFESAGSLPSVTTANALRSVIDSGDADLAGRARAILGPADNYGGRMSFRAILPFTAVLVLVFGLLYLSDRRAGGYRARKIGDGSGAEATA